MISRRDQISSIILEKVQTSKNGILVDVIERDIISDNISYDDFYSVLIDLFKNGEIGFIFEIRCPNCGDVLGSFCSIKDIPEKIQCYTCNRLFIKSLDLEDALRVYVYDKKFFRKYRKRMCGHVRFRTVSDAL